MARAKKQKFKIRNTDVFSKVFKAYNGIYEKGCAAKKKKTKPKPLKFYYKSQELQGDETPDTIAYEEGQTVFAMDNGKRPPQPKLT